MPWKITLLIAAAIAISYFDRQTLPVAIAAIQQDIPISNTQFSQLQAAFLVAYAIMYAGGGKLIDVMGTRRGFAAAMIWWSLACAAHGLANGFGFLAASRFLLGMGEGGGFPAATKAVGEWFSAKDRATAMGVINAGTAVGAVLAPPAIATIIAASGWRWVFVAAGAVGLVWAGCWLRVTGEASGNKSLESGNWLPLLGHKEIWSIVGAKFLSDAAWYFYLFWLPKYLYDVRGFDTKKVGYFAWIPYAAAGLGSLAGGWLSSWLLHKGFSVNAARKIALGCSAAVMPVILIVDRAPVEMAIAIFSIAFLGQQAWSTLVMILPTDLVRSGDVGSVAGMVGFGGAIGGVLFGLVVGYLLDNGFGYGPVFAMAGSFHVLAFLLILIVIPRIGRLDER